MWMERNFEMYCTSPQLIWANILRMYILRLLVGVIKKQILSGCLSLDQYEINCFICK